MNFGKPVVGLLMIVGCVGCDAEVVQSQWLFPCETSEECGAGYECSTQYYRNRSGADRKICMPLGAPERCSEFVCDVFGGQDFVAGDIEEILPLECPTHQLNCGEGTCTHVLSNTRHCGDCGVSCGPGEHCFLGDCMCGDGGACDTGTICCAGSCVPDDQAGSCTCGGDPLQSNTTLCCQDVWVEPETNPDNCGRCGASCTGDMTCVDFSCQ